MSYDGFYGDISTRATVNELLVRAENLNTEMDAKIVTMEELEASAEYWAQQSMAAAQTAGGGNTGNIAIYSGVTYGIFGGIGINESNNLQLALNDVGQKGGGMLVIRSSDGVTPIYIDTAVSIDYHNVTLLAISPVHFGANGYVRVNGEMAEIQRTELGQTRQGKLRLPAYANGSNQMVLPMAIGDTAWYVIGDRIVIRGENSASGAALYKQVTIIVDIVGDDIICADEPEYQFDPTYPDSEWPDDLTTGTTVATSLYSPMTSDFGPNVDTITVEDGSIFAKGDLVFISDARTEADLMAPVVTNLKSAAVMEIYQIANVTGNDIQLERSIRRQYLTAWDAGVVKLNSVRNSHIIFTDVNFHEVQTSRKVHPMAINFGYGCTLKARNMYGGTGQLGSVARVAYGYDCHVYQTMARDAYGYASAEGYGATLYYSTFCSIKECNIAGKRHNYLLQTCTSSSVHDCISSDDYISGIDLHGANCVGCEIYNNRVTRSSNYSPGVTNGGGIRNGNTSHTIGDHDTVIRNNYIEGYKGPLCAAIDVSPSSKNCMIRDNVIVDCSKGVRHYKVNSSITPAQHSDRVTIMYNQFHRVDIELFDIENYTDNSYWDEVNIIGNVAVDCLGPFEVQDIPKVIFMENKVLSPRAQTDGHAFSFSFVPFLRFSGNYAGGTERGVYLASCTTAKLVRNYLGDTTDGIPVTDGGGNTTIINVDNGDA